MWPLLQHLAISLLMILSSFFGGVFGDTESGVLAMPAPQTSPSSSPPSATTTAFVTKVIDGDTIDVRIGSSPTSTRVRYIGINTPEVYGSKTPECGGVEATARNGELVANQTITLVPGVGPYDKYGRLLAYVFVGDLFINEKLLAEGYADTMIIPPDTQYYKQFTGLRNTARTARVGNWAGCLD